MIAAILTGGRARRFHGRDKSRLVIDGRPILERQLELVGPVVSATVIVTSATREAAFADVRSGSHAVRVLVDRYPDSGPLGAILTSLEATGDTVFVLAGDMPGVTRPFIEALAALHQTAGAPAATIPVLAHGYEPLCAIYAPAAAGQLRAALEAGRLSLQAVLPALEPRVMDAEALAPFGDPDTLFRNVNTPDDLTA